MACRYREELVGKRFISVRSPQKLKIQKISEWEWRSGVVRAVSSKDTSSLDLSVLIEFDDIDWTRREWVRVHDIFQLFLVEHTLVWAERPDPDKPRQSLSWPGLSFRAVVDKAGLAGCKRKPVEFLVDRFLGLVEEKEIQIFQEGDENSHPTAFARREVQHSLKEWLDYQDGQKILLTTPTVLVGYRLEVYRAEGTTQWYTAVIQSYNHTSKTLSVTDDTVLEEHNEDPTQIQMHLIDDGVVDSILRGVEIGGIAPRRRPRAVKQEKEQQNSTTRSSSSSVTHNTTASSRSLAPAKKSRALQSLTQTSTAIVSASLTATPLLPLDVTARTEVKGLDKTNVKQRTANSKDRKRKVETPESGSENLAVKKKTKPHTPNKTDFTNTQVSDSDSYHPVRVSPRNTPAKERIRPQRSRERDKESDDSEEKSVVSTCKDSTQETSALKSDSESLQSKPKTPLRSRQKKEEKVDLPSLRRTDSPKLRTETSRGTSSSPRRRSLSRTPVETGAESVIKSNSGSSKKDKKVEKSDKKVSNSAKTEKGDLKSDLNTSQSVTEKPGSSKVKPSDNVNSGNESKKLVEDKVKEIKSALKKKEKESGNINVLGELKERKSPRTACQEKEVRRKDKKKDNENSQVKTTDTKKSVDAEKSECIEKEKTSINDSGDNMHYIKKKQSLLAGGASSGAPQNSGIPTSIDFNQSVTDQIARAGKLSSLNGEEKSVTVQRSSSPLSDRESENQSLPRENKHSSGSLSYNTSLQNIHTNSSWSQDERCHSRSSDSRCSSGLSGDEAHRPASRVDDLRSSKSSTASSPLIVDKSEPVQIYRDPELMSKNPVRSNVPSMHNPHKSYPQVHNPIPTQASRPASVGMTTSTPLSSAMERSSRTPVIPSVAYPSPLQMGPAIPGASLSSLLPPGLHQLDPATLAIHQQIAAVQQQQVAAALAASEQYRNALSMSYPPPRGSMNKSQLEHLWQQKYPSVPVPPPWLLAKHQDDLMREARILQEQEHLERERLERIERERERDIREREQRERKERERRERERMEKERLDRERREREKVEQERAERERLEREKQEKDRLEREHRERLERERRILKESVDSHAAVDQHFSESLRLASQRNWKKPPNHNTTMDGYQYTNANYRPKYMAAQTGMWPQPSITLGTGKPKPDSQSSKMGEIKPEEKIKQEQLRETDFRYAEMMRKHQELMSQQEEYIRFQKMLSAADQKPDIKSELRKDAGSAPYESHSIKREPGCSSNVKQEVQANFSLYGYKPEKYSFITTDQLQSYELEKIKSEKAMLDSKLNRSQSPRKKDLSVPPPLIKDSKPYSSVIVENKTKDGSLKSSSPQYTSHMSPHHQPKPAHTPERPHSSSSSPGAHGMNPIAAHSQHVAALRADAARQGTSRSQSPLRIASPQQLSAAVMEPMDYRCSPNLNKARGSPGSNPGPHPLSVNTSGSFSPAIAQPPVSLPHSSVPFTYSLIQQGLVPNPIYSNNSSGKTSDSQRTVSVTGTAQVPRAAQSPHTAYREQMQQQSAMGSKRKGQKESNNRKRQKGTEMSSHSPTASSNNNPLNLSVPCTTPQIVSNQSPYTTSNSSVLSSSMSTTQAGTVTTTSSQAVINNRIHGLTGFMDSFKSFVENTVQNAFMSDPELAKPKEGQMKKPASAGELQDLQQQHLQQQQLTQKPQPYKPKSSLERSSTPVMSQQSTQNEEASNLSNSGNSNSGMSYVESINRVANGQIDTDSDTLSAPSPPPHLKQDNTPSPHKAAKHPNLKKAWLQRHSDEDKQESKPQDKVTGPAVVADSSNVIQNNPSGDLEKDKEVKNCYVNCSYISPGKDGGSKSPISAILPNGNLEKTETNDSSTTSASETETQATDSNSNPRKRVKNKKERTVNPKKPKLDSDENSSASSGQGKKKTSRRSKETKTKNNADNMSEEQIKKIVENCRESVKDKDPKQTEEAYDKTLDSEDTPEQKTEQTDIEAEPQDGESSKKSEKKEKKKSKEKKDKKNKKEKEKQQKESKEKAKEQEKSEDEVETEQVYVPPPSMFKDAEPKVQQSSMMKELVRVPDSVLRKTCEPFLQDGSCSEVTPKLMKCRECKMTPTQRGKTVPNIFCRFYAFRRLKYSQRGFVTIDGFSELSDADQDDIDPWIPKSPIIEPKIDIETARFIIRRLGDKFCELVQQEREAFVCAGENAKVAWKRAVTGVREMCDVCDTTLFNMHWVCHKCGFVVCLDCYKVKAKEVNGEEESEMSAGSENEDQNQWLTCSANRQAHDVDKLMLTQIIPADALWEVGRMVHEVRDRYQILRACPCSPKVNTKKNGIKTELMNEAIKHFSPKKGLVNGVGNDEKSKTKNGNIKNNVYNPDSSSPLSLLADVASMDSEKTRDRSESPLLSKKKEGKNGKSYNPITEPVSPGSSEKKMPPSCSTLRELLTKTAGSKVKNNSESKKKSKNTSSLNDIIQKVVEKHIPKEMEKNGSLNSNSDEPEMKLLHYKPRFGASHSLVRETPIIAHNLTETSVLYPDVPHSWLCDGRLLRLHDPQHRGNLKIFMEQWKRGQPVLVSGVDKYVNSDLWKPDYFSKHFGEYENDLVNCRTGCLVVNQPMKHFWDGFSCMEERLVDEEGTPMLLKLKDWPPGDDFSDILPQQFHDLMQALPLPEYTKRDGHLNLVSRLPDFLVKPDLGPKMYIAYGSAQYPKEGTTNLHLDVSDATNVMVYVGYLEDEERGRIPKDQETNKAIEMARCDPITKRRIREVRETPGALWHIFDAVDADKIRDFLNKVGKERGEKIEQHHDPIHDQSWYLDEDLRDRLAKEYNVLGYTILQCLGDAIFVPAGAPHQVRNLNNCIKVAEDFVSPENVHHCFQLTQEFRHLSAGHSNHEDKLQIKNIVYHAIKDATAVLDDASPDDLED